MKKEDSQKEEVKPRNIFFTDPFKKKIKKIKKKYPNVLEDLTEMLTDLENNEISGTPIPELKGKVFKIRCASSDLKKGKSGGFRIIYYLETKEGDIFLLTIYAKAKQESISADAIQKILKILEIKID